MRKKFQFQFIFFLLVFWTHLSARDFTMYQPTVWGSYYNPAAVGLHNGVIINSGFQRNYVMLPSTFRTYYAAFDYGFCNDKEKLGLGGFGFYVMDDQQGETLFKTNEFGASVSMKVKLFEKGDLLLGLAPKVFLLSVDPNKMVLGDQLDAYWGQVLQVSPSLNDNVMESSTLFDMSWGVYYRQDFNRSSTGWFREKVLDVGFAMHHFPPAERSLLKANNYGGFEEDLSTKMTCLVKYYQPVFFWGSNVIVSMNPFLLYEKQASMQNVHFGVNANWQGLILGLSFRDQQYDAGSISTMAFHTGYVFAGERDDYRLAINYTFAPAVYNNNLNAGNQSHELLITYSLRRCGKKKKNNRYHPRNSNASYSNPNSTLGKIHRKPKEICPECDNNWIKKGNLKDRW